MIYAKPGTPGSKVTFKSRYGNFIGGEWVAPVEGKYFQNVSPTGAGRIAARSSWTLCG